MGQSNTGRIQCDFLVAGPGRNGSDIKCAPGMDLHYRCHRSPSKALPQSLTRIAGTDVWYWKTRLEAGWRGSYCLIPSENNDDFPAEVFNTTPPDRYALREGWRRLLSHAIADPLNPQSWRGGRGHPVSALEMPGAPLQPRLARF